MTTQNPTTLIMLLSMAKLQRGSAPDGGFAKRWQTPEDVYAQTHEAVAHLRKAGRMLEKIVLLYTDTLYLNNPAPAIGLIEKIQDQTLNHRRKLQKLFADNTEKLPLVEMLWSELVQGQKDYQSPRAKLKELYQTRNEFRLAVQNDNPKRQGEADPLINGVKGAPPGADDLFVLEETGLFDGLAKGYVVSEKINPDSDIVMAYPGPLMQSLQVMTAQKLGIYKGRPDYQRLNAVQSSWLDLGDATAPNETVFYTHALPANDRKPAAQTIVPETSLEELVVIKQKRRPLHRTWLRAAAAIVVPVATAATLWLNRPAEKLPEPKILENDDRAAVRIYRGYDSLTVTMIKDFPAQQPQDWIASAVSFGINDPGRPLNNRDDIAYIQVAENVLGEKYGFTPAL